MKIKTDSTSQVNDSLTVNPAGSMDDSSETRIQIVKGGGDSMSTVLRYGSLFKLKQIIDKRVQEVENLLDPAVVKRVKENPND